MAVDKNPGTDALLNLGHALKAVGKEDERVRRGAAR
jgi:hypothetical protein